MTYLQECLRNNFCKSVKFFNCLTKIRKTLKYKMCLPLLSPDHKWTTGTKTRTSEKLYICDKFGGEKSIIHSNASSKNHVETSRRVTREKFVERKNEEKISSLIRYITWSRMSFTSVYHKIYWCDFYIVLTLYVLCECIPTRREKGSDCLYGKVTGSICSDRDGTANDWEPRGTSVVFFQRFGRAGSGIRIDTWCSVIYRFVYAISARDTLVRVLFVSLGRVGEYKYDGGLFGFSNRSTRVQRFPLLNYFGVHVIA